MGSQPDHAARTQRLLGLVVDRRFGLAAWQPAWLFGLVVIGWAAHGRVGRTAWLKAAAAAGGAPATWVALTMHGWWWPYAVWVLMAAALIVIVTRGRLHL